jgi:hypothetical protein
MVLLPELGKTVVVGIVDAAFLQRFVANFLAEADSR